VNLTLTRPAGKGRDGKRAPPCTGLGAQCRRLAVTLRIGELEDGPTSLDHEATWLLGHTERITFGELWTDEGDLYVEAVLHVPCRHLAIDGGRGRCRVHGFEGPAPRDVRPPPEPRRLGGNRFRLVHDRALVTRRLAPPPPPPPPPPSPPPPRARSLPVLSEPNPCATAPCRTSDNRRGAACCRDLQVEIMCGRRERRLEALVRSRKAPYLCKVERSGDFSLEAEMISACGYLDDDRVSCTLHGRRRVDGRPAKPDLCTEWPPKGQTLHPGCIFRKAAGRRRA